MAADNRLKISFFAHRFLLIWQKCYHYLFWSPGELDGELPGANVRPPHDSLETIFLGPLEVVIWEIDG